MKLSENWLREWVNPPATATELAHKLNMAGLEAEAEPMLTVLPQGIVVGKIVSATPHPQADRLRVCEVDAGTGEILQIVCGAANARPGILIPAALPGAVLPNGTQIGKAALRGVESSGMLCSASELGLAEKSEGLLELDPGAKPGTPIEKHLGLVDNSIVLELTPNRGDALSILGLARETAALYGIQMTAPRVKPAVVEPETRISVVVEDMAGCPHYVGRVVQGLDAAARTPDWMSERLRRSGIRTIHPVVDITNYVLLELGQPMHGFDAAQLKGAIRVRRAKAGEQLKLLNEQTISLDPRDLLITDDSGPLVLAGVMGGEASGCSTTTTSIFLEAACFEPVSIATSGRRHKLLSDSRYRFERGVDPALQRQALERATALVQEICGGKAGPIVEVGTAPAHVAEIGLRHSQVNRLLGCEIPAARIAPLLQSLGMSVNPTGASSWQIKVPPHRYDLRIEADLVEEIGRLHGYDNIAPRAYAAELAPFSPKETTRALDRVKDALVARGYQEVVTYSFVDPKIQAQLDPETPGVALDNPIAETMSVMRTTIWSGLIPTWQYNRQRQQKRARLFEAGAVYALEGEANREQAKLAGLIAGPALPEQWGAAARPVDFFDAKADLEALFGTSLRYEAGQHPALHPGRTARIVRDGVAVGWLGALHPKLADMLDVPDALYLFELDWAAVRDIALPVPGGVSEFPSSRRDLAFVVDEAVAAGAIAEVIRDAAGPLLKSLQTFDVYRGTGLPPGRKSIAFGLIFQDYSRTLNVEEVDAAAQSVAASVHARLGGLVRD
ncbi:phenylalanine--tRNA ligase subunit beta [Nevskia sp.]|uniref:phenylalanine--tRNA ligase subunit beta n=1 Tax=Nevskia sp. TaxID=1929292 RepID=UPI0025D9EA95|nr:phenylalanine--tRNA ligase subunit beta [Nevskia sp.]